MKSYVVFFLSIHIFFTLKAVLNGSCLCNEIELETTVANFIVFFILKLFDFNMRSCHSWLW